MSNPRHHTSPSPESRKNRRNLVAISAVVGGLVLAGFGFVHHQAEVAASGPQSGDIVCTGAQTITQVIAPGETYSHLVHEFVELGDGISPGDPQFLEGLDLEASNFSDGTNVTLPRTNIEASLPQYAAGFEASVTLPKACNIVP